MSDCTIASVAVLNDEWNGPSNLEFRVYSTAGWVAPSGQINPEGSPYDWLLIDEVLLKDDVTVDDHTVTLPAFTLETTSDALVNPDTRLLLCLFDKDRNRLVATLIPSFTVETGDNDLGDLL